MADSSRLTEHMTDEDALMWHIEKDPILRSTIVAVACSTVLPISIACAARINRATCLIPRFRQHVLSPPFRRRAAAVVGRVDLRPRLPPAAHAAARARQRAHAPRRAPAHSRGWIRPRPPALGIHADRGPVRRRRHGTRRVRDESAPLGDRRRRRNGAARPAHRPHGRRPEPDDTPAVPAPES